MPQNLSPAVTGEFGPGLPHLAALQIAALQNEPDWLRDRRLAAWRVFDYLPMPDSNRLEEWRRTDISELDLEQFIPYRDPGYRAATPADLDPAIRERLGVIDELGGLIVQHDSTVVYRHLSTEVADQGVIFVDLPTAAREYPDLMRRHFLTDIVRPELAKLIALHAAFWSGGALVYIPPGRRIRLPIEIVTVIGTPGLGSFGHLLIVADRESAVTVVERSVSADFRRPALASTVTEIAIGAGARVEHVAVQEWGRGVTAFARQRARLERDARFESVVAAVGASLWRGEIEAALTGPGAEADMFGLVVGHRRQHHDHRTLQHHLAPHTKSNLLYKSVLRDRARAVFTGRIEVPREAQQTESYQANRNLLLTDRARADSQPILEILANDVRCSHGATVGPLDQDQLFYLMARGIPLPVARRLLVEGFVQPILDKIPVPHLQTHLQAAVAARVADEIPEGRTNR